MASVAIGCKVLAHSYGQAQATANYEGIRFYGVGEEWYLHPSEGQRVYTSCCLDNAA